MRGRICDLLSIKVHFALQVVAVAAYSGSGARCCLAELCCTKRGLRQALGFPLGEPMRTNAAL